MKVICTLLTVGSLLATTLLLPAQNFPTRTIKIVNGPSPDVIPRLLSEKLNKQLGVPVVIESRPGAGGEIAAQTVASSPPDGYTLLFATSSFTLNTALELAGYNFVKDFAPVAFVGAYPFVLIVNASSPIKNVDDLIALARENPGSVTCGSAGQGTAPHLACELLNRIANVKTVHVPYRGAPAAMTALLGGEVTVSFAVSTAARAQIQGGKVRGLGLTSASTSALFPGLPPLHDNGLPGFDLSGWAGFVAPAKTPSATIDLLNKEIVQALNLPETKNGLAKVGTEVGPAFSPVEFGTFIANDIKQWNAIIDTGGVARGRS
jgi:tripartite-type tricarboxylate transporter receptor subunit TctC